jgi:hypothetical protein
LAVPFGSLIPQRSRVLPQGGAVLGQLTGRLQQGLQEGRLRAAEDDAPNVLMNYLDTLGAGYGRQPTLGNLTGGMAPQPAGAPAFNGMPTQANADLQTALTPGSETFDGRFALREENARQQNPPPAPASAISYNYGDGTIRNLPVSSDLERVLNNAAAATGVSVVINSGGQPAEGGGPRTGSTRHDHGNAADLQLVVNGRPLDFTNPNDLPIIQQFIATARANGATGFGAGTDYMGNNTLHVGFGAEGVWGAGGSSATAPEWLASAYGGASPPVGGAQPSAGGGGYAPQQPAWSPPTGAERQALRAMIMNPFTREQGMQLATARMTPPAPREPDPVVINGQLVDRFTGQVIGDYRDPQAAAGTGFRPLVDPAERAAMGIPTTDAGFYQVGPDGRVYRESGGGTNVEVNLPGQPMIGTIQPGWQVIQDEAGNYTQAPIPGGPADREIIEAQQAREINAAYGQRQTDTLLTALSAAEEIVQRNPGQTTGWGQLLANLPASEARTLNSLLDTAKAIVGFETLQAMRDASPTGGALGAITERELAFLQSVQGSLDQGLSADVLLRNIQSIAASVERWNQAVQAARGDNTGAAPAAGQQGAAPEGTIIQLQDGTFQIKQNGQWVPYGG